jgi:hypothetical protein
MGIRFVTARLFCETLPALGDVSSKTLLSLGVQDCYFSYPQIRAFLRRHNVRDDRVAPEDVELTSGFQWVRAEDAAAYRHCIHQRTFFAALGFSPRNVTALDVNDYEGAEIVHDLNVPVPDTLRGRYDVIFDSGTLHYVFSVKDALFNLCRMCNVGGVIVNFNPVDFSDLGFIGLNAELFRDFYSANGFEKVTLKYIAVPLHRRAIDRYYLELSPDSFDYSPLPGYAMSVYSVYRKVSETDLTVPLQGFYRRLHQTGPAATAPSGHRLRRLASRTLGEAIHAYRLPSFLFGAIRTRLSAKKVRL